MATSRGRYGAGISPGSQVGGVAKFPKKTTSAFGLLLEHIVSLFVNRRLLPVFFFLFRDPLKMMVSSWYPKQAPPPKTKKTRQTQEPGSYTFPAESNASTPTFPPHQLRAGAGTKQKVTILGRKGFRAVELKVWRSCGAQQFGRKKKKTDPP